MSGILDLMPDEKEQNLPAPRQVPATDFTDVVATSFEESVRNFGAFSKQIGESFESWKNLRAYRQASGGTHLYQDAINSILDEKDRERISKETDGGRIRTQELIDLTDDYIVQLRTNNPERFNLIKTSQQISYDTREKAVESKREAERARLGASGFDSLVGSITGGVAAGFTDPVNIAASAIPLTRAAGIFKTMLMEAGSNIVSEIPATYFTAQWQKELGEEFGLKEAAGNFVSAGIFGAGVGGFTKSISKVFGAAKSYAARMVQEAAEQSKRVDDALAANFMAREFFLQEAKPNGIDVDTHFKLINEVEAAAREGRPPNFDSIIPDFEAKFKGEYAGAIHADVEARLKAADTPTPKVSSVDPEAPNNVNKKPTVGDNYVDPYKAEINNEKLLAEMYESPEFIAREQSNFDTYLKTKMDEGTIKGDTRLFFDEDGIEIDGIRRTELTLDELKTHFEDNESVIKNIEICSVGGK